MTNEGRDPGTTPEDVLQVFEDREDKAEPFSAAEVADELGISRRNAYGKLEVLAASDRIRTKKVGARCRVWWVAHMEE